ncbi:MAG: hypothetical protein SPD44_11120 [Prevotella sp.]|nr:hypothetical protein [Prevotella sp.]
METRPITARSFEDDYHIDGDEYVRAYKDHLSGYREWSELGHADEWLIFPENISPHVSIDETCFPKAMRTLDRSIISSFVLKVNHYYNVWSHK